MARGEHQREPAADAKADHPDRPVHLSWPDSQARTASTSSNAPLPARTSRPTDRRQVSVRPRRTGQLLRRSGQDALMGSAEPVSAMLIAASGVLEERGGIGARTGPATEAMDPALGQLWPDVLTGDCGLALGGAGDGVWALSVCYRRAGSGSRVTACCEGVARCVWGRLPLRRFAELADDGGAGGCRHR